MPQNKKVIIGVASFAVLLVGVGALYVWKNPGILTEVRVSISSLFYSESATTTPSNEPSGKYNIIVPKSTTNVEYHRTYNAILNEIVILQRVYQNDMGPLLLQMKSLLEKKDFQGLTSTLEKAKSINEAEKSRLILLTTDFDNLDRVNKTLTDTKTQSLTSDFIKTGREMVSAYVAYAAFMDAILSGKGSAQAVIDMRAMTVDLFAKRSSFNKASGELSQYLTETLAKDVVKYYTASTTKK